MTIDARCAMQWLRRFSECLISEAGNLAMGILILTTVATAASAQTATYPYTVLHKFPASPPGFPANTAAGNLLLDATGTIYGASTFGGDLNECENAGCGEVFRLSHGRITDIFDFTMEVPLGSEPSSGLIRDRAGNFYGETNTGTVYEIDTKGNGILLATFGDIAGLPEGTPTGGLTQDRAGNLLGATFAYGGISEFGEIFKVDLKGNKTVLYPFDPSGFGAENGVVLDAAGNIYGTTEFGGPARGSEQNPMGYGILYELSPDGSFTVLHNFTGGADGFAPVGVTFDNKGNLFGFAQAGGVTKSNGTGAGTIFEYDAQGNFTTLYTFTGGADGGIPVGAPLLYDGSIYGAANDGGDTSGRCAPYGCGVVFRLSPSGKETVLHTFIYTDGSFPSTGLVKDNNYNLYGAAGFIYKVGMIPQVK